MGNGIGFNSKLLVISLGLGRPLTLRMTIKLEAEQASRENRIQELYNQLAPLWTRLGVPPEEIEAFIDANQGCSERAVMAVRIGSYDVHCFHPQKILFCCIHLSHFYTYGLVLIFSPFSTKLSLHEQKRLRASKWLRLLRMSELS